MVVISSCHFIYRYMNDNRKLVGFDDDIFTKIAPNSLKEL